MIGELSAGRILSMLARDNLLPAILFRTARKQCDIDVERVASVRGALISSAESERLGAAIKAFLVKYSIDPIVVETHQHYQSLLATGVGAHHAGQLLIWRLLLEELMSAGLLRMLVATGTVAAGVDFPARTVVVTAHSKRGAEGFDVLRSSEFGQMAGRAGRRGKDAVGLCLVAPGAYSDARVIHEVSKRPPEPLKSAYFAAPATVLNLLKFRNVDDVRFTVQKSLATFLDRKVAHELRSQAVAAEQLLEQDTELQGERRKKAEKRIRRELREADELEAKQEVQLSAALEGLRVLGYIEQSGLTKKGYWAANLCTSLVLELGEAIADHLLSDLTMPVLAAVVGSIAGDPHRPYLSIRKNPIPKTVFDNLSAIIERVRAAYKNPMTTEVAVVPDAAVTILTWLESEDWASFAALLRLNGIADGDVARLVTQTADHLSQISRLVESHPDLAATAAEARDRLLRPPFRETFVTE